MGGCTVSVLNQYTMYQMICDTYHTTDNHGHHLNEWASDTYFTDKLFKIDLENIVGKCAIMVPPLSFLE